jgi:hypothetical protein
VLARHSAILYTPSWSPANTQATPSGKVLDSSSCPCVSPFLQNNTPKTPPFILFPTLAYSSAQYHWLLSYYTLKVLPQEPPGPPCLYPSGCVLSLPYCPLLPCCMSLSMLPREISDSGGTATFSHSALAVYLPLAQLL